MSLARTPALEAEAITGVLTRALPATYDAKEATCVLKQAGGNWRQTEWIGWFFEHAALEALLTTIGGQPGPVFGRTKFDYRRDFVWDFKAHSICDVNGRIARNAVLNDKEAVEACLEEHGGLGFIIACGEADYDRTGAFKAWHDALKENTSKYEVERIARGARSRARKVSFRVKAYEALHFSSLAQLDRGIREGWLQYFQEGMRNADGSPRRPKYMVDMTTVPTWARPIPPVQIQ